MTLGQRIRAGRLRWGQLPNAEGMMRLSYTEGGFLCEFHPAGLVPNEHRVGRTQYVLWWEKDGGTRLIAESPVLRCLRKIKQPFSVVLGEQGEVVR